MGIGTTLQEIEGWEGQYSRMRRWLDRVLVCANGDKSPDELDFLIAFFESAFNLRDWLINSGSLSYDQLSEFLNSSPELKVCRDITNGFKHYKIDRRASLDGDFAIVNEYVPPNWPGSYKFPNGKWTVLANGHQFVLVELAGKIAELWRVFLEKESHLGDFGS